MMNKGIYSLFALFSVVVLTGCASQNGSTVSVPTENNTDVTTVQTVIVKGEDFSPDALLEKLTTKNQQFATGWNPNTDIWVISVQEVKLRKGMTETEAADIAAIRAKNQIASYMGSSVSAQEELIYTEETKDDKTTTKEFFKSIQKVDVNQFLRGVTIFRQEVKDGHLCAAFYVTGKLIDASAQLEKQLRGAPPGIVRACGFGIISDGKIAPAKRKALQGALRNAVEQVMGTMVIGQSQLMDNEKAKSKVISQTAGNIKQYRIVKEGQFGNNYQVIVNAQVDEKHILDNYAALVRSMGNPGFFIKTIDPDLQYVLSEFFNNLGFLVTSNLNEAYFVVDADCKYLTITDDHYGNGIQIDIGLRLYDIKNNQQLLIMRNMPRLTSTYSGTFHQIRQSAAKKAFKTMKKQLHEKLNKVVMDWVLNGRQINVVFTGCPADTSLVKVLEDAVKGVPCAKVYTKTFEGGEVKFACSYVGTSDDFEYFLQERLKKDLPGTVTVPKTIQLQLNNLVFKFNERNM